MRLRCTNCDASFDGERNGRCPKCLRRTSVVQTMDSTAPPRDGTPAPWPDGTRCPLCLAQDVSAATFHLEIEKTVGAGSAATWLTVRARCCDGCSDRVRRLGRLRLALLPIVALGTIAWPLSMVSMSPMGLLGLERVQLVMVATLLCALVVAVPLVVLDHANRSLRKNLEESWLFRRIRTRVQEAAAAAGAANEHWRLLSRAPSGSIVVEATELLRAEPHA